MNKDLEYVEVQLVDSLESLSEIDITSITLGSVKGQGNLENIESVMLFTENTPHPDDKNATIYNLRVQVTTKPKQDDKAVNNIDGSSE